MQLRLKLAYYALAVLLSAPFIAAQLSRPASRLAENLGLLLGLPLDTDMPRENSSSAPDFLMDVYNCWTALGTSEDRSSCLPVHDLAVKDSLDDVNVVRSIKAIADEQSSASGVFSHSSEETPLPASLALTFNVSILRRVKEDVRYAYIRVPKMSLTVDQLEGIKNQCTDSADVPLNLLVKVNTTENSRGVFSLLSTAVLSESEIGQEKQIEFRGITEQFRDWLKETKATKMYEFTETRIIVGGSCYNSVTPADLGISPNTSSSAYIVAFSKSDDSEEAVIKAGLAELAAEATANRRRRNADDSQASSEDNSGLQQDSETSLQFNASLYHLHPCTKYSHTISFQELGWSDYILQPPNYEANFCAGSCDYPLTEHYNTTKHSYIQSLAAKLNPDFVPPPCCTPHELSPVTVLYEQSPDLFVTHEWHGMQAESCGCK